MLTLREQRNFQFDFLRPQHSLFQYFTKLLEQYTNLEDQDHGGGWDATGEAEIASCEHFLQGGAFKDQKFAIFSFCFQDANTLAYYNMTPGTMLQLQLKERGGRKK